jgi:hypothetical protein
MSKSVRDELSSHLLFGASKCPTSMGHWLMIWSGGEDVARGAARADFLASLLSERVS